MYKRNERNPFLLLSRATRKVLWFPNIYAHQEASPSSSSSSSSSTTGFQFSTFRVKRRSIITSPLKVDHSSTSMRVCDLQYRRILLLSLSFIPFSKLLPSILFCSSFIYYIYVVFFYSASILCIFFSCYLVNGINLVKIALYAPILLHIHTNSSALLSQNHSHIHAHTNTNSNAIFHTNLGE